MLQLFKCIYASDVVCTVGIKYICRCNKCFTMYFHVYCEKIEVKMKSEVKLKMFLENLMFRSLKMSKKKICICFFSAITNNYRAWLYDKLY